MPKQPHTLRIDEDVYARIGEIARESGKKPSLVMQQLIDAGLESAHSKPKINSIQLSPELFDELSTVAQEDDRTAENLAQHLLGKTLPRYKAAIKSLGL